MESTNLHRLLQNHHLQIVGSSSSSTTLENNPDSSCFGASTTAHQWSPSGVSLNNASLSLNYCNEMLNTRDHNNGSDCMSVSNMHTNSLLQQDLAVQWHHSYDDDHHHNNHQSLSRIKEEFSTLTSDQIQADNIPKLTDMLNTPLVTTNYLKINEHDKDFNEMTEKLLLKTISSGFPINREYCNYSSSFSSASSPISSSSSHRGSLSQIYPSVNISSFSQSPRMNMNIPRPFDMNMHVLDGRSVNGLVNNANSPEINLGMMPRESLYFGLGDHHLQQTIQHTSCTPIDQMPLFSDEPQASEGKRSNLLMTKKGGENVPKKPRVESRSSCPPLKIRKEKLGDRIAALQQLVSPFGKTDTASVLMEAIGYIKFLQNQIETLSVPYKRSSRNRTGKSSQEGHEEQKSDLRSRGLCLVPLSCISYVTGDGGGNDGGLGVGFWPAPPGFGGGP